MQGFLLQIDEAKIIAHEADEPNAVVDFLDPQALTGQDGRDVDPLAIHADASAGGDQRVAVVQGVGGSPGASVCDSKRSRGTLPTTDEAPRWKRSPGADFLREMITFAAHRLMELEVGALNRVKLAVLRMFESQRSGMA